MSGQKGQNGPHALKCSKCKLKRDEHGNARRGNLTRTGRMKMLRRTRLAHELYCTDCHHYGWYTHRLIIYLPWTLKKDRLRGDRR